MKNKFITAQLSTAAGETGSDMWESQYVVNPQLKYWIDAKEEYEKYNSLLEKKEIPQEDWSFIASIVLKLGDSLTVLFGANHAGQQGKNTPALKTFIDTILPWKLEKEDPDLYEQFKKLDEFHKDVCKHFDRSKIHIINKTTIDDLNQYMETTRKIWLWFIRKHTNGVIITEVEKEFSKEYL